MEHKEGPDGPKEWKDKKNKMRGIKSRGLEVRQQGKPHGYMAIPEGKLSGLKALGQTEPHGVKIGAEVTIERDLAAPDHLMIEPENHGYKE